MEVFDDAGALLTSISTGYEDGDELAVGDITGDGQDDVAIARDFNGRVVLFSTTPPGIGSSLGSFDAGYEDGDELSIADMDGDGFGEVLVGRQDPLSFPAPPQIVVFNAGGSVVAAITAGEPEFSGFDHVMDVADVDGDGAAEAFIADHESGPGNEPIISGYELSGATVASFTPLFDTDGFALGDIDGDLDRDVVLADSFSGEVQIRTLQGGTISAFDLAGALPSARDGFDAGDVTGTLIDTIVVGRPDLGGVIQLINLDGSNAATFAAGFQQGDALAVGTPRFRSPACQGDQGETRDIDGDGLLDTWETNGIGINRGGSPDLDLPGMGAKVGRRDIFVELDFMELHKPRPEALDDVVKIFAGAPICNPDGSIGVTLHIQVDEELPHQDDITALDGDFDAIKQVQFGTPAERAAPNAPDILAAKRLTFHYNVWAHMYNGTGSSGLAEFGGNDFIVTLGAAGWGLDGSGLHTVGSRTQQAGSFFHELGHNLGLSHGGASKVNCKPNYLSMMNYTFAILDGIPLAGGFHMDYSRTELPQLAEAVLDEPLGIEDGAYATLWSPDDGQTIKAGSGTGSLDWNGVGGIDLNPVIVDVNNMAFVGCGLDADKNPVPAPGELLSGFDDWSNLDFTFRDSADFADGAHGSAVHELDIDTINDVRPRFLAALAAADPSLEETRITKGPTGKTRDRTPAFSFASDDRDASFECSVDGEAFIACASPHTLAKLDRGPHAFLVRAVHPGGTIDATPARADFEVAKEKKKRNKRRPR